MPVPDVPWGARDTSALAHELIHRWVHEGADPAAIDAARARHAARGEDLRTAARALERAQSDLAGVWRGRGADAAGSHLRSLAARMTGLGDAVTGQAGSLGAMRDALARVQAAVRSPRPPVFGPLRAPPAAAGLADAVLGGPRDGFGLFHAAQAEERAAQSAYQAYLRETSAAARGTPPALEAASGRAPGAGPVPVAEPAAPARGAPTGRAPAGPPGPLARAADPAAAGAARAAGATPAPTGPGAGRAAGPSLPLGATPPGSAPSGATPPGSAPGAVPGSPPGSAPGSAPSGAPPGRAAAGGPSASPAPSTPAAGPTRADGLLDRVWQRVLGPEAGTARAPAGPGVAPAGEPLPPAAGTAGSVGGTAAPGGGPGRRGQGSTPSRRPGPGPATPSTPADRLLTGDASAAGDAPAPGVEEPRDPDRTDGDRTGPDREATTPATGPGARTGLSTAAVDPPVGPAGPAGPDGAPSAPPGGAALPLAGPVPGAGAGAAATGGTAGAAGTADGPGSRRPDYLVEADPWGEGDDARLVTPPVLGSEEHDR